MGFFYVLVLAAQFYISYFFSNSGFFQKEDNYSIKSSLFFGVATITMHPHQLIYGAIQNFYR